MRTSNIGVIHDFHVRSHCFSWSKVMQFMVHLWLSKIILIQLLLWLATEYNSVAYSEVEVLFRKLYTHLMSVWPFHIFQDLRKCWEIYKTVTSIEKRVRINAERESKVYLRFRTCTDLGCDVSDRTQQRPFSISLQPPLVLLDWSYSFSLWYQVIVFLPMILDHQMYFEFWHIQERLREFIHVLLMTDLHYCSKKLVLCCSHKTCPLLLWSPVGLSLHLDI